jgi:putative two-component system hydrogenase maturation factor HypX/HoxX
MEQARPMTAAAALSAGLVDRTVDCTPQDFTTEVTRMAAHLASRPGAHLRLTAKKAEHERRESATPLAAYRERELARMLRIFTDPDAPYHALRRAFVRKEQFREHSDGPAAEAVGPLDC